MLLGTLEATRGAGWVFVAPGSRKDYEFFRSGAKTDGSTNGEHSHPGVRWGAVHTLP
jgi:hypothetical protein